MNSTIIIKEKKCKCGCGKTGRIFSKGMLHYCWGKQYGKPLKRVSEKQLKKHKITDESWKNLRDEADTLFSLYIRLKEADKKGYNDCFTCGERLHYKQLECGHCIQRSEMGLRFEEINAKPQCKKCNSLHETKPEIFRSKLPTETIEYLDEISHQVNKLSVSDLKEIVIDLREKVGILKNIKHFY